MLIDRIFKADCKNIQTTSLMEESDFFNGFRHHGKVKYKYFLFRKKKCTCCYDLKDKKHDLKIFPEENFF